MTKSPAQSQRKRSHTKSRGGCITCKIRRKKCDEERPSCRRCISTGRKCDGYAPCFDGIDTRSDFLITDSGRRHRYMPAQPFVSPIEEISITPLFPGTSGLFLTDQRYLDFFRLYTIPEFSSYYDSTIWQILFAQTCISDSALQCAALALGAAHLEHETYRHSQGCLSATTERVSEIYLQAISDSRQTLGSLSPSHAVGVGFVLSFLLAGVEALRGTYCNATMHLANGLKIAFSRDYDTIYHKSILHSDFPLDSRVLALLERLKETLSHIFDLDTERSRPDDRIALQTLQDAFLQLSEVEDAMRLTENDLQLLAACLEAWDIRLAKVTSNISQEDLYKVRLLKAYREAIYLMLLAKASHYIPEPMQPSTAGYEQRLLQLKVHCSKLMMLEGQLNEDKAFVTHLAPAQMKNMAIKHRLFGDQVFSQRPSVDDSPARSAAEQLIMLEEDAIRESGLAPLEAVCMDITSALERGTVSIRYCILDSAGLFLWVEKRVEIWRPAVFQADQLGLGNYH